MSSDQLAELQRLFDAAILRPPGEREAYLAAECAQDPDLESQVLRLLAHHTADESLPGVSAAVSARFGGARAPSLVGRRIGPYRVISELGSGGMGRVFQAERVDLGNRVALKVVREPLLSAERIARFELEQLALARMEHENIARLFDAGLTEDRTPWFAMELVEGRSIVEFAEQGSIGLTARLQLLLQLCDAIQYAHGNLVVHRDIKPSNVLVTPAGRVKVLDFGVARLLETSAVPTTRTDARIYTPGYAAPEQLTGDPITVATDVYQIGVVAYELLSGVKPHDVATLSPLDALRAVVETDPAAPSRAGSGRSRLKGDLDSIVLQALEKRPDRRYASVESLAGDIRRFLRNEPVLARRGGASYRARKFVRRHRVGTAFAALVVGSLVTAELQRRAIGDERDEAERQARIATTVSDFMVGLFELADPTDTSSVGPTDLVDRGASRVNEDLILEPRIQASLQETLGRVYLELGKYPQADSLLGRSLQIRLELLGSEHPETIETRHQQALLEYGRGDMEAAETLVRSVLDARERSGGRSQLAFAKALTTLGSVLYSAGRYQEAEATLVEAAQVQREFYSEGHEDLASTLNSLANSRWGQDRHDEARETMTEALAVYRKVLNGDHPYLAVTQSNLAYMAFVSGAIDQAEREATEVLAMQRRLFPEGHRDIPYTLSTLADVAFAKGDTARTDSLWRAILQERLSLLGREHADVILSYRDLGSHLYKVERFGDAERTFRAGLALSDEVQGSAHPDHARFSHLISQAARRQENDARADRFLADAYRVGREAFGPDHPWVHERGKELADVLRQAGDSTRARAIEQELAAPGSTSGDEPAPGESGVG